MGGFSTNFGKGRAAVARSTSDGTQHLHTNLEIALARYVAPSNRETLSPAQSLRSVAQLKPHFTAWRLGSRVKHPTCGSQIHLIYL